MILLFFYDKITLEVNMLKNNKKIILIISILLVIVLGFSLSYAFFYYRNTLGDISLNSGEIDINFTAGTNNFSLGDNYPKSDVLGVVSTNYFDFSVSGTIISDAIHYELQIKELNGNTLDPRYVKVYLTDQSENVLVGPINLDSFDFNDYNGNRIIYTKNLTTSSQVDYYRLRVWLSDEFTDSTSKTFAFKVNLYARNVE